MSDEKFCDESKPWKGYTFFSRVGLEPRNPNKIKPNKNERYRSLIKEIQNKVKKFFRAPEGLSR
jgi:hypothetical protein